MDPLLELADAMTVLAPSQPALCPNPGTQQHGAATASSPGAEEDPEDDPLLSLAAAVGSTPAAAAAVTQQQDTPKPEAAARPCSQLQRTPGALTATAPPVEAPAAPSSSTVEAAGVVAAKRGRAWLSSATPAATAAQDQLRAASGAHASTSGNTSSSGVQHYIETLTGIKIKNPLVCGVRLRVKVTAMEYVPLGRAKSHRPAAKGRWVTLGVLVSKSIQDSKGGSGGTYSRWRLSNLKGEEVVLMLFGGAHTSHYAMVEGSVVGVYCAKVSDTHGSLSIAADDQLERLATSAGFGFCKGITKAGGRCTRPVDTTVSPYCEYHVLSQAKALNAELRRGPSLTQPPASAARAALLGSSRPAASSATAAGGRTAGAGSQSAGGGGLGGLRATPSTAGGAGLVWAPQQLPRAPGAAAAGKGAAKAAAGTAGGAQRSALLGAGGGGGAKGQSGSFSKRLTDRERTRLLVKETLAQRNLQGRPPQQSQQQQQQQQQQQAVPGPLAGREPLQPLPSNSQQHSVPPPSQQGAMKAAGILPRADIKQLLRGKGHSSQQPISAGGSSAAPPQAGQTCPSSQQQQQLEDAENMGFLLDELADAAAAGGMVEGTAAPKQDGNSATSNSTLVVTAAAIAAAAASKQAPGATATATTGITARPASAPAPAQGAAGSSMVRKAALASSLGLKKAAATYSSAAARAGSSSSSSRKEPPSKPTSDAARFRAAFGAVAKSVEGLAPNQRLLAVAEAEERAALSRGLDALARKEAAAEQLEGIKSLQVSAWQCKDCARMTERRPVECRGHQCVEVRVTKRWFRCDACGWKVTTLGEVLPSRRCPKCRDPGKDFTPCSAFNVAAPKAAADPALAPLAAREHMLPRGVEHGFCLNG